MIGPLLSWYLVVQLVTMAVLPLSLRLFGSLPDRGYVFAKSLGILLVGFLFWWGYSYGLLRNDAGGAWVSVLLIALFSLLAGRRTLATIIRQRQFPVRGRALLMVEFLFLFGFLAWAIVRAYDPAANHTEQPMDLMFMNSIWASANYPPQDAWFAGYAISYYYFGYWLLTTLGRLSGQAPAVAYTVGQACWFGLLLIGSYGVVFNLLAWSGQPENELESTADQLGDSLGPPIAGGLLAAIMVAVAGNGQVILEWLYANGWPVEGIASWFAVHNFPASASVSNDWFIGRDWWWWRSGRVLEDLDLMGNHIEVIAEFPMFSYLLGDNHPHVIAMPMVLLVIGLAMSLVLRGASGEWRVDVPWLSRLGGFIPMRWGGLLVMTVAAGALLFLNTWDFPPYWALLVMSIFVVVFLQRRKSQESGALGSGIGYAVLLGVILAAGTIAFYLPYLLTAQSQAGGFLPNLFHPTRLPQFLLFFGIGLSAMIVLIVPAWSVLRPGWGRVAISFLLVYGLPAFFLTATTLLATSTSSGDTLLARMPLPSDVPSHATMVVQRWLAEPWTFLLAGGLLAAVAVLIWRALEADAVLAGKLSQSTLFALLLAGLGLTLVYAPEFIYLRDNFGTRMNTVFKFYYQGWLLFGLSGSYAIVQAWRERGRMAVGGRAITAVATALALLLVVAGLLFPIAGVYSKTGGFSTVPTLDSTAYVANENPAELAAARWIDQNTAPDARVLEGKGASYRANFSRMSALTGRPTLLGWDGHESQWRGSQYGAMAAGRPEALEVIYSSGLASQVEALLETWNIDYVYIGPSERWQYGITPASEAGIAEVMDLVFDEGDVRIYRRRGS